MIAYKAFEPGLICRGYQFVMGLNQTERANCRANGFHCAENPLDCLSYYPDMAKSEFYLVKTGGDIDEDGDDTKIACTELAIIRKLTQEEFFLHGLAFMVNRPKREWSSHVKKDRAQAKRGYAVVRGIDPVARGGLGDILAFAKEDMTGATVSHISLAQVDGIKVLPDLWYGVDLNERQVLAL
jgi:hypothetical protein